MSWIPMVAMAAATAYSAYSSSHGKGKKSSQPHLEKFETMSHREKDIYKDLLKKINPKILDIGKSSLFQKSQNLVNDLLSDNPQAYEKFKKPMMNEFNQEIIPGISERFAGLGGESSSGFQQALGSAGAGLEDRLASLRSGLQMQGIDLGAQLSQMPISNMMQLIQQLYSTPSYGYANMSGQPGFAQSIAPGIGQGIGSASSMYLMNKYMK